MELLLGASGCMMGFVWPVACCLPGHVTHSSNYVGYTWCGNINIFILLGVW